MNRTAWLQDRRMQKFRDVLSRWERGGCRWWRRANCWGCRSDSSGAIATATRRTGLRGWSTSGSGARHAPPAGRRRQPQSPRSARSLLWLRPACRPAPCLGSSDNDHWTACRRRPLAGYGAEAHNMRQKDARIFKVGCETYHSVIVSSCHRVIVSSCGPRFESAEWHQPLCWRDTVFSYREQLPQRVAGCHGYPATLAVADEQLPMLGAEPARWPGHSVRAHGRRLRLGIARGRSSLPPRLFPFCADAGNGRVLARGW